MREILLSGVAILFAAAPTSTNYILRNYDVGSGGGTTSSSSSNYRLNGVTGGQGGQTQNSTNYTSDNGFNNTVNTNAPTAPTFSNTSNYYNRLRLIINTANNPSDTKYQVAISTDNFVTTSYIQNDNTIGSASGAATYQTYAAWGSGSGVLVTGLTPSTTYKVKVRSLQGSANGSAFGPVATAATVATSMTVSLATTATATPPFPINFTSLTAGNVVSGTADAVIGLDTNALNGGYIYVRDTNNGLTSTLASSQITSVSTNLTSTISGYGGQVTAASQTSGGPLTSQSPFNGSGDSVGALTTSLQTIVSSNAPVTGGNTTFRLKAKAAATTPAANDYNDTITFVAVMNF